MQVSCEQRQYIINLTCSAAHLARQCHAYHADMQKPVVAGARAAPHADTSRAEGSSRLPEWQRRWRDLQTARADLARRRENATLIESAFQRVIAPRERKLTNALALLTARLIRVVADGQLDSVRHSLLSQWIIENLGLLDEHPFADTARVDSLIAQWRSVIAPGALMSSGGEAGTQQRPVINRPQATAHQHHQYTADSESDAPDSGHKESVSNERMDIDDLDMRTLIAPLFRRLAQALHPDREPDVAKRILKEELMRQALDARTRGDVGALLELHQQHIADPADGVDGVDGKTLLRAIAKQMEVVQRGLRVLRFGNPLLQRIMERYGQDPALREQRIQRHAGQLDDAVAELTSVTEQIGSPGGLESALQKRSDAEMDKHVIGEMTGANA